MDSIIDDDNGIETGAHPYRERLGYLASALIIHGNVRLREPEPHPASAHVEDIPPQSDQVSQCGGTASARCTGPVRMLPHDPVRRFNRHSGRHRRANTLQLSLFRKPRPRRRRRDRHCGSTLATPSNACLNAAMGN
ncbi:hypothetical protein ACFYU5_33505 [Nocardia aobensis]|uniref:Uncharacterized protein n=1 Tax=Nocardia aobensis TaxID=257277 RepID=A0ABW6PDV5_9NOCA